MTGGSVAVVGANSVLEDNVVDKQITYPKLSKDIGTFLITSLNLMDKTKAVDGYDISGENGTLTVVATKSVSDFVKVDSSSAYTFYKGSVCAYYDINKVFISWVNVSSAATVTTPVNAKYIRYSFLTANKNTTTVTKGSSATTNAAYSQKFTFNDSTEVSVPLKPSDIIGVNSVSGNLLVYTNATVGIITGDGITTDGNTSYYTLDFAKVKQKTQYGGLNITGTMAQYDINKNLIRKTTLAIPFTTDADTYYVRLVITTAAFNAQSAVLSEGSIGKPIVYTLGETFAIPEQKSKLNGLTWNVLGDSYTAAPYSYHKWISDKVGCTVNNYGIVSSTLSTFRTDLNPMCVRYVDMLDEADIVTVFGGVNDSGTSGYTNLGDINSTDTTTIYGALNVLYSGLLNKYPDKVVATITPVRVEDVNRDPVRLLNVRNAIIAVSEKYALPCLDLYGMSGLSLIGNRKKLYIGSDGLHPTNAGYKKISYRIQEFLESIVMI